MARSRLGTLLGGLRNITRALWSGSTVALPDRPLVVLITGASTGIGLEIARVLLAQTSHTLVLTAREASLGRFAEVGIQPSDRVRLMALDVVDPIQRGQVIRTIRAELGGVDVLVNNAGISYRSVVEHVSEEERLAQMDINFLAPMALTRKCLKDMRRKGYGRIVHISSVGGMTAMPTMAAYAASKFALEGASESLWYEVRPWGIAVVLVQPGFINSDGFERVRFTDQAARSLVDPEDPYHQHYEQMERFVARLMRLTWATPRSVAERVVAAIAHPNPPLRVAGTFDALLFAAARRVLPRRLYHTLLYAGLPKIWTWGPRRPDDEG